MSKKIEIKTPGQKSQSAEEWVSKREGMKRLTIDVPASMHTQLKIASIKNSQTMADLLRNYIEDRLKNENL